MSDTVSQATEVRTGRVAAIYARVSSERQRQDETIQSQTVGLRELAAERGLLLPEDLVFEDAGFSALTAGDHDEPTHPRRESVSSGSLRRVCAMLLLWQRLHDEVIVNDPLRGHRATLADVAAAAGVSVSTASRAMRDHPRVAPVTRGRVVAIAETVGFARNDLARSLRTRASMLVGVVLPDVAIPFYASVLKGAQSLLEGDGYEVLVMNTEREPARERRALRILQSRQVDAVLVATSGGFVDLDIPVVFFDHVLASAGVGAVAVDNVAGMEQLVAHLAVRHRHRRIAFLGAPDAPAAGVAPLEYGPASERLQAFRAAMGRRGLAVPPDYVVLADHHWSQASAEHAIGSLLGCVHPPTAVIAAGDTLALGAMRRLGFLVPGEIALVSFDDPVDADLLKTPMTALRRHDHELGDLAAGLLLRALAGEPPGPGPVRLALELVVRASCGCAEPGA